MKDKFYVNKEFTPRQEMLWDREQVNKDKLRYKKNWETLTPEKRREAYKFVDKNGGLESTMTMQQFTETLGITIDQAAAIMYYYKNKRR